MKMLPKDPIILVSVLNTKLRDIYPSLTALCDDLDENESEVIAAAKSVGYEYSNELNQFKMA